MKYLVEEESLIAIADAMRDIDIPYGVKLTFPDGFIDGINQCYNFGKNIGYSEGSQEGYDEGYTIGYWQGEDDGYNSGYDMGYMMGEDDGYTHGKQDEYNRLIDDTKLLPTTITGSNLIRIDDVSEIPIGGYIDFSGNALVEFYFCGRNLINPQEFIKNSYNTTLEDDVITSEFTNASLSVNHHYGVNNKPVSYPPGTYTLTFIPVSNGAAASAFVYKANDSTKTCVKSQMLYNTQPTMTITMDEEWYVALGGASGKYGTHSYKIQLEAGGVAMEYEKYCGYKTRMYEGSMEYFCPTTTIYTFSGIGITATYNRSYGYQTAYDTLWDRLQQNGNRKSYACAFGGWTSGLFKPKYNFQPTDAYMMFRSSNISDLRNVRDNLGNPITLDFSKCTNFQYMFQWATTNYVGEIDVRATTSNSNTAQMFGYATYLISIDKLILKDDGTQKIDSTMFSNATALQSVMFEGVIPTTLSFSHSKKLNRASIENVVGCLSTTATGQTITFSKTAINKAFETTEGANDGMVSAEFEALMASRENWTFGFST